MPSEPRLADVRILVAEDDEDARDLLEMALVASGAVVLPAANGSAAIPILLRAQPEVVVTDLAMPHMDGYEVLRATREILPGTPCLAVTAFAFDEERARVLAAGFDAHVPKPVDYAILVAKIAELLGIAKPSGARRQSGVKARPRRRAG